MERPRERGIRLAAVSPANRGGMGSGNGMGVPRVVPERTILRGGAIDSLRHRQHLRVHSFCAGLCPPAMNRDDVLLREPFSSKATEYAA